MRRGPAPLLLAAFAAGCASPTYSNSPSPGSLSSQNQASAYQAGYGGTAPATATDAVVSAGAAVVDTALGRGRNVGSGAIRGQCFWKDGSPCSSIGLILKTSDGIPVSRQRTDSDGRFAFPVGNGGGPYLIEVSLGSVAASFAPDAPLRPGMAVELRLSRKGEQP